MDENKYGEFTYFMVKTLSDEALAGVSGILEFDDCFSPSIEETEQFDKLFPPTLKRNI